MLAMRASRAQDGEQRAAAERHREPRIISDLVPLVSTQPVSVRGPPAPGDTAGTELPWREDDLAMEAEHEIVERRQP